jgi:tRNA nucleotidyltransferase (CCA-adding enzyme)
VNAGAVARVSSSVASRSGASPSIASRLRRLLLRPEIVALARALEQHGARGWIVGGATRDLLLGRPVPDVDLAVSADPWALARQLEAAGFGTAVALSNSAPRVARLAGMKGKWKGEIDLAELEGGGIRDDLGRRDFTVNAVAVELSGGDWIDPFGGREDLARGRLRMISEANLRDDPLRVLRVARFLATHGLAPDPATSAACARVAPRIASAAPERIRVELEKLLAAPRAQPALAWAARAGVLGTALGLSLTAAQVRARLGRARFDAPGLRRLPPQNRARVRLTLLAGRLGMEPEAMAAWLAGRRFSRAVSHDIGSLARLAREAARPATSGQLWGWVRDAGDRAPEALLLARLLWPAAQTRRQIARHARTLRARQRPPRVTGEDVLAWLSIPPGPAVGRLLREVEIEGLRGALKTRAQARRWLVLAAGGARSSGGNGPPGEGSRDGL